MIPRGIRPLSTEEIKQRLNESTKDAQELIITITPEALKQGFKDTLSLGGLTITFEEFEKLMESKDPLNTIITQHVEGLPEEQKNTMREQLRKKLGSITNEEFKSALFLTAVGNLLQETSSKDLLTAIKEEHITIQPEFITVHLIKLLPTSMYEKALTTTTMITQAKEEKT